MARSIPVIVYIPPTWIDVIDKAVKKERTSRSRFMSAVSHETAQRILSGTRYGGYENEDNNRE